MNINEFIALLKEHDFCFEREGSNAIERALYALRREEEHLIISEIQRHPEWFELYQAFKHGVLND